MTYEDLKDCSVDSVRAVEDSHSVHSGAYKYSREPLTLSKLDSSSPCVVP
jgi:hypothetical protein